MADVEWEKVREIFDLALRRRPEERRRFVHEACGEDHLLFSEIESLLSSHDSAESFMETPAVAKVAEMIEPDMHRPEKDQNFGRYKIIEQIGEGGMGTVYLAEDTRLGRKVALKLLPTFFTADSERVRRFEHEARAASALNHPNVCTIHEVGEADGGRRYIAMEYVEGETLRQRLQRTRPEVQETLDIAVQVAAALDTAHRNGIVHRDIKPENVMLRADGLVKVLDFGLAKLTETKGNLPVDPQAPTRPLVRTNPGVVMGTVTYMSPEQARGLEVDERTDIWSLGVVFYEMIAGCPPFPGVTSNEIISAILSKEPPPPITRYSHLVPERLEEIVEKALTKNRDERYQTSKDLLIDLKRLKRSLETKAAIERSTSPDKLEVPTAGEHANVKTSPPEFQNMPDRTATPDQEEAKTQVLDAPTTDIVSHTTSSATNEQTSRADKPRAQTKWWLFGLLGLIVLAAGFFAYRYFAPASKQIQSIAVMPFVNETADPQVEYLSDGMTDTLISSLSELPNIKVKARTSVFRYKGKEIDPKTVGKELGVQAIINGRVAQRDGRTTVTLEVVDTETEDVIFSTKYNKPQSELVTLQSDIARDVSGKLKSKLSGAEEAKVTKTYTADPEALQLYLQGQFYRHKGGRNNVLLATDYFNKAIEKDPNYALAYAGLALNYSSYGLYNLASPEYGAKANAAAKRAVELDNSLAEAHVASGTFVGNPEQEFRRAIELNPNYADAHVALCIFLTMNKRFDEGITEGRKAQELDPSSAVVTTHLGAAYFFARRPDEAIETFRRAHEMDPTLWVPLGYLGGAQTLKGQYTEAAATFRKAIEISDGSPNAKSHLAYALAKAGQRDVALKLIDELKRLAEREHINTFHFAVPYIGLGDKDEAFFWLGKGIDEGSIGFAMLDVHPWFDDLRSDPRFKALLKRVRPPES